MGYYHQGFTLLVSGFDRIQVVWIFINPSNNIATNGVKSIVPVLNLEITLLIGSSTGDVISSKNPYNLYPIEPGNQESKVGRHPST